jgi:hypothetical protein
VWLAEVARRAFLESADLVRKRRIIDEDVMGDELNPPALDQLRF